MGSCTSLALAQRAAAVEAFSQQLRKTACVDELPQLSSASIFGERLGEPRYRGAAHPNNRQLLVANDPNSCKKHWLINARITHKIKGTYLTQVSKIVDTNVLMRNLRSRLLRNILDTGLITTKKKERYLLAKGKLRMMSAPHQAPLILRRNLYQISNIFRL